MEFIWSNAADLVSHLPLDPASATVLLIVLAVFGAVRGWMWKRRIKRLFKRVDTLLDELGAQKA
jgi:hypothetical protein